MSEEFQTFLRNNGMQHITTAVHTPHSSGAAEYSVKTLKASFKKLLWQDENSTKAVQAFLFMHRATPYTTTEYSPAELQMGHRLRTGFNLLIPSRDTVVEKKRESQSTHHTGCRKNTFTEDQNIYMKHYTEGTVRWIPAVIVKQLGNLCDFSGIQNNSNKQWVAQPPHSADDQQDHYNQTFHKCGGNYPLHQWMHCHHPNPTCPGQTLLHYILMANCQNQVIRCLPILFQNNCLPVTRPEEIPSSAWLPGPLPFLSLNINKTPKLY
ncbi:hypothetical protein PR048_028592 [Dryococelus australis]|uniref:Integrase catalytic domain-containing protein n=1 Tax=Dryococelus australis TaxID=614101 RepID=A0ABQ9GB02_9NEOP|nr:hypothetical protein PR048_028592 [Dryococelus australis]